MGKLLADFILPSMFSWKGFFAKVFGFTADVAGIPDKADGLTGDALKQYSNYQSYLAAAETIDVIETVLWIMIGVVGLAAVIYAIYLGFNLAKAADQSKRDEAKKHLITVVIAIAVTLALVVFFLYLLPGILGAFKNIKIS